MPFAGIEGALDLRVERREIERWLEELGCINEQVRDAELVAKLPQVHGRHIVVSVDERAHAKTHRPDVVLLDRLMCLERDQRRSTCEVGGIIDGAAGESREYRGGGKRRE